MAAQRVICLMSLLLTFDQDEDLFIYFSTFSYSPIQMDPIMVMVVEIFQQQMLPMLITVCTRQHFPRKHRRHLQFLIICKHFLDQWANHQFQQAIRTVSVPIIKLNNTKI